MKTYIVMYEKETLDQAKALFEAEAPAKSDKLYLVGAKETSISMADARILFELPIKPIFINPAESILTYTIGYLIGANKTDNITLIINKEYADLQAFIKETGMDINIIVSKAARKVKKEPIQTPASKAETARTKDTSAKNMETTPVTQPKPRKRAVKVTADTFDELIVYDTLKLPKKSVRIP